MNWHKNQDRGKTGDQPHGPLQPAEKIQDRPMTARLLKKAGLFLLFLWAAGSLIFFLVQAVPGDPLLSILGPQPALGRRPAPARVAAAGPAAGRAQYAASFSRLAVLDLGESLIDRKPVLATILKYLPNTILLTVAAMAITVLLSLPLGFLAAFKKSRLWEALAMVFSAARPGGPRLSARHPLDHRLLGGVGNFSRFGQRRRRISRPAGIDTGHIARRLPDAHGADGFAGGIAAAVRAPGQGQGAFPGADLSAAYLEERLGPRSSP